jgi:p-aminobenzoyl-glutamate transporter AbgT
MKLALSFLFVLICSNILSLPILDYVFNRYMPFEIGLIIFISFMFAVPAFLSPLFSRFVKNKKDNNVLDN